MIQDFAEVWHLRSRWIVVGGFFLFAIFYYFNFSTPTWFPTDTITTLSKGEGLATLSTKLEVDHVVRSSAWFRVAVIILGGERGLQAGDYYLPEKQNALEMAWRMVHGERELTLVKITIPEGFTVEEIADLFDSRFMLFNKDAFLKSAKEGYVFPDTYFIAVNATASSTIELFTSNFDRQIAKFAEDFSISKRSEQDIIIMASILEAEVQTEADKKIVAGILWKRLSLGMPLQVDSAPDTYKTTGLPMEPIDNPGLISIGAALHPTASPYLYFISGKDGIIHYAKTIDEQTKNIQKYL